VSKPPEAATLRPWEARERDDEDAIAGVYHETHHDYPIARRWNDDFFEFVAATYGSGERVLDLGSGPGSLWEHWRRLPNVGRLVGCDISERMVEEAQRRFPDGEFVVGRVHAIPFEDSSFDLVIASSVLHHVPDVELPSAFAEIKRVLAPYGHVVGREPLSSYAVGASQSWTSGAMMNFRHLVYRLTRTRDPEMPELGSHHHVPEVKTFIEALSQHLKPLEVQTRFPFSPIVMRVQSERIAEVALLLDEKLRHRAGTMFYYAAVRDYATAEDVARCVDLALADDAEDQTEFLAYLQAAAQEIEKVLQRDGG
jgi:ubiquinone/menaquinone biosynthesis C-methylase UbiE